MTLGNVLWEWVTVGDRVKQREVFFLVAAFQLREKERTPFAQFIHAAVPGDLEEPGFEWGLGMSRGEGQREFRHFYEEGKKQEHPKSRQGRSGETVC